MSTLIAKRLPQNLEDMLPPLNGRISIGAPPFHNEGVVMPFQDFRNFLDDRGRYRDHCQWEFLIDLSCFE